MLTKEQFQSLLEHRGQRSVSIFMPTHRAGAEVQQDPIRLRNLLAKAQQRLVEQGARTPEARQVLQPGHELVENAEFWVRTGRGLALFLAPGRSETYNLPLDFEELLVVTDRFHIKPLLPLFNGDGRFLLLALSQNEFRLLDGTRYSFHQVELPDVPKDLETALVHLGRSEEGKQLQFHTRTARGTGERAAMFYGTGSAQEKDNLRKYFRQIDAGLRDAVQGMQKPLVLAGVDYLLPIYREVSDYSGVVKPGIAGNPETLRDEELHARAWEIVEPLFAAARKEAAAQYHHLAGNHDERASADLQQIVLAAYHARVAVLFVTVGQQQWGAFDRQAGTVTPHDEQQPGDLDLLDFAAAHTTMNGGTVYAVEPEAAPAEAPAAAVFRY